MGRGLRGLRHRNSDVGGQTVAWLAPADRRAVAFCNVDRFLRHLFRAGVNPDPGQEGLAKAAPVREQLVDGFHLVGSP